MMDCDKLAKKLSKLWHIKVIQVIGQEFIAEDNSADSSRSVLIHVVMLPRHQIQLTIRAETKDAIELFKKRQSIQ